MSTSQKVNDAKQLLRTIEPYCSARHLIEVTNISFADDEHCQKATSYPGLLLLPKSTENDTVEKLAETVISVLNGRALFASDLMLYLPSNVVYGKEGDVPARFANLGSYDDLRDKAECQAALQKAAIGGEPPQVVRYRRQPS